MTGAMNNPETRRAEEAIHQVEEIEVSNRLGRMQRLVATSIALVAGAAGGIAVFATDNGAGSVALLALGALFGLLALSGRSLVSAKFGENEVVFDKALRQSVVRRIAEASPQVAVELAGALVEADAQARQPLVNWARGRLYEQAVADALRGVAQDAGFDVTDLTGVAHAGADFQLRHNDDAIDVQIRRLVAHHTIPPDWILPGRVRGHLLIIAQEAHKGAVELLERQGARIVTWDGPQDNEALRKAVEELAGKPNAG